MHSFPPWRLKVIYYFYAAPGLEKDPLLSTHRSSVPYLPSLHAIVFVVVVVFILKRKNHRNNDTELQNKLIGN